MPASAPDLSRPAPVPRPLFGPGGVLEGLVVRAPGGLGTAPPAPLWVTGVTHDSTRVRPGDLYAALPGARTHGARFAAQAVDNGAVAVITDPAGAILAAGCDVALLTHEQPRSVLGEVAARVYGRPGQDLLLVGVTGTNGKTTLTYLLDSALRAAGHITGVIGTVGTRIGDVHVATARTTPEATDVHALLAVMRERGVTAVAMEVSSHAMVLGRVDGLRFDVAVFTNLSQDHLDFHHDLESYYAAKVSLFTPARAKAAVVCIDDDWGLRLQQTCPLPTTTYGLDVSPRGADWTGTQVLEVPGGSAADAHGPGGVQVRLEVQMPGRFNVANALGALAVATVCGEPAPVAAAGIAACAGVPGRMERIADPDPSRGLIALVDYAHTPDAVGRAVLAARAGTRGRVTVVVGAGGDRDPGKRTDMGRVAAQLADVVVVTDDNPRSEDPALIRAEVVAGARAAGRAEVVEIADRGAAIAAAVAMAVVGADHDDGHHDVVLVLGKGHEQGQEIAGVVTAFDDRAVLAAALGLAGS